MQKFLLVSLTIDYEFGMDEGESPHRASNLIVLVGSENKMYDSTKFKLWSEYTPFIK